MKHYVHLDESGHIRAASHSDDVPPAIDPDWVITELPESGPLPPMNHPDGDHLRYHYATQSWHDTRSLIEVKLAKWAALKAERDAREFGTLTFAGGEFDIDARSQARLSGTVQLAMMAKAAGQPFAIDWTLADNSVRTLTADDVIAIGVALGQHVVTQHAIARQLRAALAAAPSDVAVANINWPT